jgi:uncharacterized protein (DUF2384 family)
MTQPISTQVTLSMQILEAKASAIVASSTSPEADGFDSARWLARWLQIEQPALGGCRAVDLIGTADGLKIVSRLIGSLVSGAYQ